jgi:hypothetical protein
MTYSKKLVKTDILSLQRRDKQEQTVTHPIQIEIESNWNSINKLVKKKLHQFKFKSIDLDVNAVTTTYQLSAVGPIVEVFVVDLS